MNNKITKYFMLSSLMLAALLGVTFAFNAKAESEIKDREDREVRAGRIGQMMSRPEVMGTVTAISGNIITVKDLRGNSGTVYTADATNAIIIKNGQTSTLSAIQVNDTISVQGVVNGTSITATKINDGLIPKEKLEQGKPRIVGTVTAISGTTLTVKDSRPNSTATYTVNTTNSTIVKNGQNSTLASIIVGEKVSIQGAVNGTTITATKINVAGSEKDLENQPNLNNPMIVGNGQPIIAGTVSTISGNTITITNKGNITYTIDTTNAKIQTNGTTPSTVSNISVNDNVIVQGTINGTNVTASLIIDQKPKTDSRSTNSDDQNKPKAKGFFGGIGNWFRGLFGF